MHKTVLNQSTQRFEHGSTSFVSDVTVSTLKWSGLNRVEPFLNQCIAKKRLKTNVLTAATVASAILILLKRQGNKKYKRHRKQLEEVNYLIKEDTVNNKPKAHVDKVFFKQLSELLRIVVPGWTSAEAGLLALVAATLVARTICDLWMINHGTKVESAIVSMDRRLFQERLFKFFLTMPVISVVNNLLKWSIGELKIRLRTNLTLNLYDDYLQSCTYYRMANLDNRISNADQLLTTDVDKFCESLADLYCNVAKPLLDIGLYVYRLTVQLGGETPAIMLGYLVVSGAVLTRLRRPTGRLTMSEQKLEGEFRHINARLITNSEEVAFYRGSSRERATLLTAFNRLVDHLRKFLKFRVLMGVVDNIIAKYVATVVGFYAVSRPFLSSSHMMAQDAENERFRLYYTFGRMLVKLAEAIGRLVLAGRELTRLAGFTARVTQLRHVMHELHAGRYQRTQVVDGEKNLKLSPGAGKIIYREDIIKFEQVPLVTPNGDVLLKELSFEIRSGENVLVCGPNGCGKSSLFRILGELWSLWGGVLTKPPGAKLFYVPQRPYMTLGPLRDQLTYPHSAGEAARRGTRDEQLLELLSRVQLSYLASREGGLDAVADWLDVLSGGEKQRVAVARLLYHAPRFALLDECTSAVSVDVEGALYKLCRARGITLITVSHRRSLWPHHQHVLHMDGHGGYYFRPIDHENDEPFGS